MVRHFSEKVEKLAQKLSAEAYVEVETCTPISFSDRAPKVNIEEAVWVEIGGCYGRIKRLGCHSTPSWGEDHPQQKAKIGIEKIAADLGHELGVAAVPCGLIKHDERYWALSIYPFEGEPCGSFPRGNDGKTSIDFAKSSHDLDAILEAVKDENTALWAFHVWIGDQIEHTTRPDNMLLNIENGTPCIAAIDHAGADLKISNAKPVLEYLGPFNGRSKSMFGLYEKMDIAPHNPAVLEETIVKIETMPEDTIRKIVGRIPDELIPKEGKEFCIKSLMQGQSDIRGRMNHIVQKLEWKSEHAYEQKTIPRGRFAPPLANE